MDMHSESHEKAAETPIESPVSEPVKSSRSLNRIFKRISCRAWTILAIAVLLAVAIWFGRALVLAAVIDGRPVGRVAVLHELESRSGRAALDALISRRLIEHEAKTKGVTVSDQEVKDEIKRIETQLAAQGMNLDEALQQQSMSRMDLVGQLIVQKKMEKLLGDRINVTDAEVDEYVNANKVPLEKGKEAESKQQLKEQMRDQKLSEQAGQFESELREKAHITYYGSYDKPTLE